MSLPAILFLVHIPPRTTVLKLQYVQGFVTETQIPNEQETFREQSLFYI